MADFVVDTHVHVVSDDEDRYPLRPGELTGPWYRDEPCSVERLLGLMDEADVARAVLVQGVSAYGFDNRYTLDAATTSDRCIAVAAVDPSRADAPDEVGRQVAAGSRGIRWFLDPRPFGEARPVFEAVAAEGVPLVVTVLPGRLAELAAASADLPTVPVALDHCGFPDLSGGVPDALVALAALPQVLLKVSTMTLDQLSEHGDVRDGLAELSGRFGADRLMWGSDWSQTHDRPYTELVELARDAADGLSTDDRARYLGGTACAVWPELAP